MSTHMSARSKSRVLRMMAILLPIIIILAMLLLVLLDDGADVPNNFNYHLY